MLRPTGQDDQTFGVNVEHAARKVQDTVSSPRSSPFQHLGLNSLSEPDQDSHLHSTELGAPPRRLPWLSQATQ
ncbi:unnamed protein product [Boreogadus saida]